MSDNRKFTLGTDKDVRDYVPGKDRLCSATHEEILSGATADVYLVRTREILAREGKADTVVTAEIFPSRPGILAGMPECLHILKGLPVEVWGLDEGAPCEQGYDLRITGPYSAFGIYETALLGSCGSSAWAAETPSANRRLTGFRLYVSGKASIRQSPL